jgi:sugar-specific transcriptional regulator TrmB
MNNISSLIDLGLSDQEAQTYLSLLRLGGSKASDLAKEMGIKRTSVYVMLKSLSAKGFASVYFRKTKRFYYPLKPNKLSSLFEKKLESLNNYIPLLETMEKKQIQVLGLRFIETKNELELFYNEILEEYKNKKNKEYYIIGSTPAWESALIEYFDEYRKNRASLGIKTKLLLSAESKEGNPHNKSLLREFKYLPEKYKFKSTIDIFDDKILIINPNLGSLAVVIAIPAMVDVFKSIFDMLWEK